MTGPMIVVALIITTQVVAACVLAVGVAVWLYDRLRGPADRARTYPLGSPERRALEGQR